MAKGFLEGLFDHLVKVAAVQDSMDEYGRPDPKKAMGIAYAMKNDFSLQDMADMHDILKANGAFEEDGTVKK